MSSVTGKEKIQDLETLYKQLQNPELYVCVRILKSNYDQIGTDTSIKPQILLTDNIRHFKSNDARISEIKHLTQCLSLDTSKNEDLALEIEKQLGIYKSVFTIQGGKTQKRKTRKRKYKKVNRKHKKSRKY
jgi:hypothetical protein